MDRDYIIDTFTNEEIEETLELLDFNPIPAIDNTNRDFFLRLLKKIYNGEFEEGKFKTVILTEKENIQIKEFFEPIIFLAAFPVVVEPVVVDPVVVDPAVVDPAVVDSAVVDPAVIGPAVVDPAVIAAQPASSLQFISQGFDASSESKKQQELSQSSRSLQHQPARDYNSQNYAQQVGLQKADNMYSASGVSESDQVSSHPDMISHVGEDGVPYEIPPTMPMPPSQSQDQNPIDQQHQQQENKFQMNAIAPVCQSLYSQSPSGQLVPVPVSTPAVDTQMQSSTN